MFKIAFRRPTPLWRGGRGGRRGARHTRGPRGSPPRPARTQRAETRTCRQRGPDAPKRRNHRTPNPGPGGTRAAAGRSYAPRHTHRHSPVQPARRAQQTGTNSTYTPLSLSPVPRSSEWTPHETPRDRNPPPKLAASSTSSAARTTHRPLQRCAAHRAGATKVASVQTHPHISITHPLLRRYIAPFPPGANGGDPHTNVLPRARHHARIFHAATARHQLARCLGHGGPLPRQYTRPHV